MANALPCSEEKLFSASFSRVIENRPSAPTATVRLTPRRSLPVISADGLPENEAWATLPVSVDESAPELRAPRRDGGGGYRREQEERRRSIHRILLRIVER
jgi:hypothetical protein